MHPDDPLDDDEEHPRRPAFDVDEEGDDDESDVTPSPIEAASHGLRILDQPGIEEEPDDDFEEVEARTVLITGASGNIGRKLRRAWEGIYDLVLIDRDAPPDDHDVIVADLAEWDESWVSHFDDVDTVIHLAANPDESATWDELVGPNLDALANVFNAAAYGGVERLIFASSNHAMGGYRDLGDMPITADLPPRPDGPYGGTKLVGERLGRSLAAAYDITFIALRLGWVQRGANLVNTLPDDWSRKLWLSDDDMVRLFESAVEAELGDRHVVVANGMSNNSGMRWDLSEAVHHLGYEPADDSADEAD